MARSELSDIIADVRGSYKRSNIRQLNLADEALAVEERLGYVLQQCPRLSSREYTINFDPVETIFLQKLISERTLGKKIVLTKEQFFKGIVFLDFLTEYILKSDRVLDELCQIADELERINQFLDPDLELATKYSALCYAMQLGAKGINGHEQEARNSQRCYNEKNTTVTAGYVAFRKISPVYDAIGRMVCNLVTNPAVKEGMQHAKGVNDIKSLIFVDCILEQLSDTSGMPEVEKSEQLRLRAFDSTARQGVESLVQEQRYFAASVEAISALKNEVPADFLRKYYDAKIRQHRRGQ